MQDLASDRHKLFIKPIFGAQGLSVSSQPLKINEYVSFFYIENTTI